MRLEPDRGFSMRDGTTTSDRDTPAISRAFSRSDGKRAGITIAILVVVGACYWFMLPAIQSQIIPDAPGGTNGPWVLRPIFAFRFIAVGVMASVTLPFITGPLRRKWKHEDAATGSRYDPFAGRPVDRSFFMFKGVLLLIIYAAAPVFYLLSWETIGPGGIEQHLAWTTRHHSFQDIASLETIPDGERSESINRDGPWYSIRLRSGRSITWSLDNEGITQDELTAITTFVAQRSGLEWVRRSDTRAR
jgi:hypothetical protein